VLSEKFSQAQKINCLGWIVKLLMKPHATYWRSETSTQWWV